MVGKRGWVYAMTTIGFVILIVATVICAKWLREDFSPHRYGIKAITLADGQKFYLKREVGLHYDRTSLSLNGEQCKGPDDSTDYRFSGMDAGAFPIYYLPGTSSVTVYAVLAAPTHLRWPTTVRHEVLDVGAYGRMAEDYKARGISRIEIALKELSPCQ
jgi:hypothetical protein